MQVDPVGQWPGHPRSVAAHLLLAAGATPLGIAQITAGTGIHRRDQLELCRKVSLTGSAGNGDSTGFQGLPEHLQHPSVVLRQFVQKQYSVMSQRNLAGARLPAAANQRDPGCSVMRGAERPDSPLLQIQPLGADRGNRCGFQRLILGQRWHDAGQPAGQHSFSGAGWANHQQVVAASGGDFQRPFGVWLTAHIAQIPFQHCFWWSVRLSSRWLQGAAGRQLLAHFQQVPRPQHFRSIGQSRFSSVVFRGQQGASGVTAGQRRRQYPAHPAQFTTERQFTKEFILIQPGAVDLPGGGQDAQRNRQIETSAFLGQIRRGQVDGDATDREFKLAVEDCAAHAILAFLHRRFRQPDDGQPRQPAGQMDFDADQRRIDANLGAGIDDGERHANPGASSQ